MNTRHLILAGLFLLVPLSGCFSEPAGDPDTPAQKAQAQEQNIWDFGMVEAGKVVEHDFTIKNDSRAPLQIKDVSSSCGCTVSEVRRNVLQKGESTWLNVKFNSKGYHGPVRQFVYVDTDDAQNPVMRFIVKADVFGAKLDTGSAASTNE